MTDVAVKVSSHARTWELVSLTCGPLDPRSHHLQASWDGIQQTDHRQRSLFGTQLHLVLNTGCSIHRGPARWRLASSTARVRSVVTCARRNVADAWGAYRHACIAVPKDTHRSSPGSNRTFSVSLQNAGRCRDMSDTNSGRRVDAARQVGRRAPARLRAASGGKAFGTS